MRQMMSLIGYMVFVIQLPVAGLQRLLFRKQAFYVAECYTALLFFNGHLLALGVVGHVTGVYATRYGALAIMLIGLFYFAWAVAGLYRDRGLGTLSKAIVLYIAYTVGRFAIGAATMMAIIRLAR